MRKRTSHLEGTPSQQEQGWGGGVTHSKCSLLKSSFLIVQNNLCNLWGVSTTPCLTHRGTGGRTRERGTTLPRKWPRKWASSSLAQHTGWYKNHSTVPGAKRREDDIWGETLQPRGRGRRTCERQPRRLERTKIKTNHRQRWEKVRESTFRSKRAMYERLQRRRQRGRFASVVMGQGLDFHRENPPERSQVPLGFSCWADQLPQGTCLTREGNRPVGWLRPLGGRCKPPLS